MDEQQKRRWNSFRLDEADIRHTEQQIFEDKHPNLAPAMRGMLIDWLVDVAGRFRVRYETFFGAVTLYDRYMASPHWTDERNAGEDGKRGVQRDHLQCVGCACFYIMSLLQDVNSIEIRDLHYVCDRAYSIDTIAKTCHDIVVALDGDVYISPTSFDFLKCITASFPLVRPSSMKVTKSRLAENMSATTTATVSSSTIYEQTTIETLARYFIEQATIKWTGVLSRYKGSVCACAAFALAHTIVAKSTSHWFDQLCADTKVPRKEIVDCARAMYSAKNDGNNLKATQRRYRFEMDESARSAVEELLEPATNQSDASVYGPRLAVERAHRSSQTVVRSPVDDVYSTGKELGSGTYGVVRCAASKTIVGLEVAVKKFTAVEEFIAHSTIREISIMCKLNHPNIVRALTVFFPTATDCCMTMPLMQGGSLRDYMRSDSSFRQDSAKRRRFMRQICSALAYMHNRGIAHRDLKSDNVVIDSAGETVALIDFGMARYGTISGDQSFSGDVCTLWYQSPEVLLGERRYDATAIDLWSLACVFAEMALDLSSNRTLFPGDSKLDQLFLIFRFFGTPNEDCWPGVSLLPHFRSTFPQWKPTEDMSLRINLGAEGYHLFLQWTRYNPDERMSAHAALQTHPYFQDQFVAVEMPSTQ